jgi:hypothetical protein
MSALSLQLSQISFFSESKSQKIERQSKKRSLGSDHPKNLTYKIFEEVKAIPASKNLKNLSLPRVSAASDLTELFGKFIISTPEVEEEIAPIDDDVPNF